jgi:hypothetical protein
MKRFNSLEELGLLIPWNFPEKSYLVSEEERDLYVSLLTDGAQYFIKQTGNNPLFRGVELVTNETKEDRG